MATPRVRTRNHGFSIGYYSARNGITQTITRDNLSDSCEDVTDGHQTDNRFLLTRNIRTGGMLNGFRDFPLSNDALWADCPTLPALNWGTQLSFNETEDNAARRGFNITNPGRAEILAPVFLAELRDIPRMVRQLGDTLRWINNGIKRPPSTIANGLSISKKLAADNLAYQFGWAPLLSDLKNMALMTDSINRRRKELSRLHSGRGLKRRVTLEKREAKSNNPSSLSVWTADGTLLTLAGPQMSYRSWVHRWATFRYAPTKDSPLPASDHEIRMMVMGLTLNNIASNLWEAIPWTWLADWFSNLGDIVESTNNSAHVSVKSCCIMTHSGFEYRIPTLIWTFSNGSVKLDSYHRLFETKARRIGLPNFPIPELSLPHLGGSQLSILGSLAVTRAGGVF